MDIFSLLTKNQHILVCVVHKTQTVGSVQHYCICNFHLA